MYEKHKTEKTTFKVFVSVITKKPDFALPTINDHSECHLTKMFVASIRKKNDKKISAKKFFFGFWSNLTTISGLK